MNKKLVLVAIFATLCSSLSVFAGDLSSLLPTKEFASLSYSHGFNIEKAKDGTTNIMTGSGRLGAVAFWNNSHVGFGANISLGGAYNINAKMKLPDGSLQTVKIKGSDMNGAMNFAAKIACAFDIPINNNINLLATIGPCYDIMLYGYDVTLLHNMVFGVGTTLACVVGSQNLVNFVFGLDLDYDFIQLGYVEVGNRKMELSAHTSFTEIRPFVGISLKTDKIFRSATPSNKA